jgi:hypothetical protein
MKPPVEAGTRWPETLMPGPDLLVCRVAEAGQDQDDQAAQRAILSQADTAIRTY